MTTHAPHSFEQLERRAQRFAHRMVERGGCACCASQALISAAVELAYANDTLPQVREMMQSWIRATEADAALGLDGDIITTLPH